MDVEEDMCYSDVTAITGVFDSVGSCFPFLRLETGGRVDRNITLERRGVVRSFLCKLDVPSGFNYEPNIHRSWQVGVIVHPNDSKWGVSGHLVPLMGRA